MIRFRPSGMALLLALVATTLPGSARGDSALFSFGELRRLQELPREVSQRSVEAEELILYQNMEFYVFTVFESLQAANNAALALHEEPLFCAPIEAFHFLDEGDITGLARYVTDELMGLNEALGASPQRFDHRPASEVLLLALRAAFPCKDDQQLRTASVVR